jgi:uncharacterized membrane protein
LSPYSNTSVLKLTPDELKELQSMLQPGDRATVARRLKYKYTPSYVSAVVDPNNPRYNREIVTSMIKMLLLRTKNAAKQHKRLQEFIHR